MATKNPARGDEHWARRFPEKVKRGDSHYARQHPEWMARGSKHGCSKLNEEQVKSIRHQFKDGGTTKLALAHTYHVAPTTIGRIIAQRIWKHLT